MGEYKIGQDIQKLEHRIEQLEQIIRDILNVPEEDEQQTKLEQEKVER
jgi:hypothetical protein